MDLKLSLLLLIIGTAVVQVSCDDWFQFPQWFPVPQPRPFRNNDFWGGGDVVKWSAFKPGPGVEVHQVAAQSFSSSDGVQRRGGSKVVITDNGKTTVYKSGDDVDKIKL